MIADYPLARDRILFMDNGKIILASESPRRQQMLSWILPEFESLPADIDENPLIGELPVPYCQRMALGKALHFADSLPEGGFVLGSDTTVYINHQILGKPRDEDHAEETSERQRAPGLYRGSSGIPERRENQHPSERV